jgi:catechol 1,2-dioxygenase
MNQRGTFVTDADGRIAFRTVRPAGYPVPVNGPVGALLRAQGRHNMRPAHLHFLITKAGFKAQFSQVYADDDPHIDDDVQFGVTEALRARFERHVADLSRGIVPPAADVPEAWSTLHQRFVLLPGEPRLPVPPVAGKATQRPTLERLARRAG